jgi:predicted unusual protein kinase regulating ubiquinone biosynthesis (AarF/ABC1/UbiB family)
MLAQELGEAGQRGFSSFDAVPIATASIGQVHRAQDHLGKVLVVKIQYPGVSESVDSDVDNLRSLLALARLLPGELDVDALTDEIKRELHREVDYEREAEQLDRYHLLLRDDERFSVPRPVFELSSKRVLTMEQAAGQELLIWSEKAPQADRDHAAGLLIRLLLKELFELGLCQTDPNPANYFYDEETRKLVLLDLGAARVVPPEVRAIYQRAFVGIARKDRAALRAVVGELGIDVTGDSPTTDTIVSLALDAAAIFQPGSYDFERSDLAERLKARSGEMRAHQKNLRAPAPHFVFFQRKVAGTFLLCRSLRAKVDCRALLEEQLELTE